MRLLSFRVFLAYFTINLIVDTCYLAFNLFVMDYS